MLLPRLGNTCLLMGVSFVLALIVALPAGVLAAMRPRSVLDYGLNLFAFAGISMPSFWLGLLLILLFSVQLGWLPASGVTSVGGDTVAARLIHLILPVLTLTMLTVGSVLRFTRSAMIETLRQDYVRTAYAKGLGPVGVVLRHALRNAMIPVVTVVALHFGALFSGALVVETMFAYLGMGKLIYDSIIGNDFNVALVGLLFATLLTLLSNLGADVLYAWLDPRISYERVRRSGSSPRPPAAPAARAHRRAGCSCAGSGATISRWRAGSCSCCWRSRAWPRRWSRPCSATIRTRSICWAASRHPSAEHPLGTDELGRDLLLRLLYGGQVSLFVGLVGAVAAASLGTVIGLVAGYVGGRTDALLMRLTDAVIALPLLPLLIVLAAIDLGKLGLPAALAHSESASLYRILVIVALVGWTTVARLVRGATLSVRERDYVRAAVALGAGPLRIMTAPHPAERGLADHRRHHPFGRQRRPARIQP